MWQDWNDIETGRLDTYISGLYSHGALAQRHAESLREIDTLSSFSSLRYRKKKPKPLCNVPKTLKPRSDQSRESATPRRIEGRDIGCLESLALSSSCSVSEGEPEDEKSYNDLLTFGFEASPDQNSLNGRKSRLGLLELPSDILLLIMKHVSEWPLAMYWLRHTSAIFMTIFDKDEFAHLHEASDSYSCHKAFDRSRLTRGSLYVASVRLLQHLHCDSCQEMFTSGTWRQRWQKLHSHYYCSGCKTNHSAFMFLSEDRARHDLCGGRLLCIGRQGEISLCCHSQGHFDATNKRTMWRDMDALSRRTETTAGAAEEYGRFCAHPSHESVRSDSKITSSMLGIHGYPRLIAFSDASSPGSHVVVEYGWDLPLLEIPSSFTPSLRVLQGELSSLVVQALEEHKICPHVSPDREILEFVQTGICHCFRTESSWPSEAGLNSLKGQGSKNWHDLNQSCRCGRKSFFRCRECGASYMWRLLRGYVSLSFRHSWRIKKPISVGWISLLDQQWRNKIFDEGSRHLLWCDNKDCRTHTSQPWDVLVKDEVSWDSSDHPAGEGECSDLALMELLEEQHAFRGW
ncbi:uncharacterized protein F5Z01DRAFT_639469 [Emericellopsis atlantica]|uniref:F-box domain-containing protein n=1 Tax=Emericellopsis atlantica TaxID=2614577 RepID=A0A9P8CLE9_9HYPO|nr:uncharacterized protein F5Z01DRAFT_639469 [Emericellopsis atlantica]KAG9251323.1 hypothetical protein F5Z01DRAFT_639469 [Emericellopsis atlantica]